MSNERTEHRDSHSDGSECETLRALFESICEKAKDGFLERGEHAPVFFILTRLGIVMIPGTWEPDVDKEAIARSIRRAICDTLIQTNGEPVQDEPTAVILASEAWMVVLDENEPDATAELPPRLHPRRKEILQVTLRSRAASFCRNWPIVREGDNVTLGSPTDLDAEHMESVWDIILTG